MDGTGTYWVTARGEKDGDSIVMYGEDEDPAMQSMGLDKEFVIILHPRAPDRIDIETRYVDTRTPERRELPFLAFELRRPS